MCSFDHVRRCARARVRRTSRAIGAATSRRSRRSRRRPRPRRAALSAGANATNHECDAPERVGRRAGLPGDGDARNLGRRPGAALHDRDHHLGYVRRDLGGNRAGERSGRVDAGRRRRRARSAARGTAAVRCRRWRSVAAISAICSGVTSSAPWPKPICASSPGTIESFGGTLARLRRATGSPASRRCPSDAGSRRTYRCPSSARSARSRRCSRARTRSVTSAYPVASPSLLCSVKLPIVK